MKKEEIQALFKIYEDAVSIIDESECWSTRELCKLLGYTQWRNFNNVIDKAKEACDNAGQPVPDHFADVSKTIPMPKGAVKDVDDVMLTERGIVPEDLPASEDVKKVERRLASEEKKMLKNKKK